MRWVFAVFGSAFCIAFLGIGIWALMGLQNEIGNDSGGFNFDASEHVCARPKVGYERSLSELNSLQLLPEIIVTPRGYNGGTRIDFVGDNCGLIQGPIIKYPDLDSDLSLSVTCYTEFTVGEFGDAVNVFARCDDKRFTGEATLGVRRAKYAVRSVCDLRCSEVGQRYAYPIKFEMTEQERKIKISPHDILGCPTNHRTCDERPTPQIEYPRTTARLPDASCIAEFTIGDDGKPIGVDVTCSHRAFTSPTERAIVEMQYLTEDECGPCKHIGQRISYPIEFRLED